MLRVALIMILTGTGGIVVGNMLTSRLLAADPVQVVSAPVAAAKRSSKPVELDFMRAQWVFAHINTWSAPDYVSRPDARHSVASGKMAMSDNRRNRNRRT